MRKRALPQPFGCTPPWVARAPSKGCLWMQGGGTQSLNASGRKRHRRTRLIRKPMTYRIQGLDPAPYLDLYGLADDELALRNIMRVQVTSSPGFPCRVSLADRRVGEAVLLVNHLSHDVTNPYRARHAIFVGEGQAQAAEFIDEVPPVLGTRVLSLRGFDADGMMVDAALAQPGAADQAIRHLFENSRVAEIHAHNATRGCFAAKIERN